MDHHYDFSKLASSFQAFIDNPQKAFQILDILPFPVEVFAPEGTAVYANPFGLVWNNIQDASLVIGKYNVLNDPVLNDQMGLREDINRAFRGEVGISKEIPVPFQDLVDRNVIEDKPFKAATMNVHYSPILDGDRLAYVICFFIVKSKYDGNQVVAEAKAYLDAHWRETIPSPWRKRRT